MLRNKYARFAGLLVLLLFASGRVFAQSEPEPCKTPLECYEQSLKNLQDTLRYVAGLQKEMEALKQSLTKIKEAIERGNPWESFSENLKDVIEETNKYEYAVIRNGGFRTLTASEWNGGWRVVTSPHMTGDRDVFRLGGSMWIWDTRDSRDDRGIYHLYYYYGKDGVRATQSGNGLDLKSRKMYRRLRK